MWVSECRKFRRSQEMPLLNPLCTCTCFSSFCLLCSVSTNCLTACLLRQDWTYLEFCFFHHSGVWLLNGAYSSLKVISHHKLIGRVTIRRCVIVGVGTTLLEKVYHCEGRLWCPIYVRERPSDPDHFLLSVGKEIRTLSYLSITMAVFMLPSFKPWQ